MTSSLKWQDEAACIGTPVDLFFELYEINGREADAICNECPVQKECLLFGVGTKSHGCWGGIYLEDGSISKDFNVHKTKEDWTELWMRMSHSIQNR